jgi:hypothetical protein
MTKRNNRFFGKELSLDELNFDDMKHVSGGGGENCGGGGTGGGGEGGGTGGGTGGGEG